MSEDSIALINRLSLLLEINITEKVINNIDELLNKIASISTAILLTEATSIALLDEKTNELVFHFVDGSVKNIVSNIRVPYGIGISGWVLKYGIPLIITDVQNDNRFSNKVDKESGFTTRSSICVPIKKDKKIIGVIQSLNKKNGTFTNDDLSILKSLAIISSIVIENTQLYTLLSQKLEQIEAEKKTNEHILNQLKLSEEKINKLKDISDTKGSFSGHLDVFRIEYLIQMLSNDYKTGRLTLKSTDGIANIFLDKGKIKYAEIKNRNIEGINILYEILCWNDGNFHFEQNILIDNTNIEKMPIAIIIEGLKRLDESNEIKEKYPYTLVPKLLSNEYNLENNYEIDIIKLIDNKKDIKLIINDSKYDRCTTLLVIRDLSERNIINFE